MNRFEHLHDTWANSHPFVRFVFTLLIASGVFFLVNGPVKSVYQKWKKSNNLELAQAAFSAGRYAEARNISIQILRQDDKAYKQLPILLRSTHILKDPFQTNVAVSMLLDQRTLPEDHALAWTYLCQSGPSYLPLSFWPLLPEPQRQSLDYQLPIIDRLIYDRMMPIAATIIANSPKPYPVELQYRLLTILAKTATPESYAEFHRSIAEQLRATPETWPRLLELIDEIPQSELDRDIYDALPQNVGSDFSMEAPLALRILRCQMAVDPDMPQEWFETTFSRFQTSDPAALARWCLRIGRPADAAKCIDLVEPAKDPDRYRLQINILEANGQSAKLASFLNSAPGDIPAWETLVHLAAIARADGDQDIAKSSINDALQSATENPDPTALIELARYAQDRKLDDLALDAWTRALIRGTGPLPLSQSLTFVINELSEQQREDELYAVLNSLCLLETNNPLINVQYLYLACLSGRAEVRSVIDQLRPIQEKFPDQLALRCILAIAHVLSGEIQEADALTNDPKIDWFGTSLVNRAIRGIVLAKNNELSVAQVYFEDFPWDALLPSEKRIFKSLVKDHL
jgi:hypothetical protein